MHNFIRLRLIEIKKQLYALCQAYLSKRLETAEEAMGTAQSSAHEETKSSAGDKYETSRAMMELEVEKNAIQVNEVKKLKHVLDRIQYDQESTVVQPGSIVVTNQGNFYIAISAGQLNVNDTIYMAISPASPIGSRLMGLQPGAVISFNQKEYKIEEVG